jgi:hypothetical protein
MRESSRLRLRIAESSSLLLLPQNNKPSLLRGSRRSIGRANSLGLMAELLQIKMLTSVLLVETTNSIN